MGDGFAVLYKNLRSSVMPIKELFSISDDILHKRDLSTFILIVNLHFTIWN